MASLRLREQPLGAGEAARLGAFDAELEQPRRRETVEQAVEPSTGTWRRVRAPPLWGRPADAREMAGRRGPRAAMANSAVPGASEMAAERTLTGAQWAGRERIDRSMRAASQASGSTARMSPPSGAERRPEREEPDVRPHAEIAARRPARGEGGEQRVSAGRHGAGVSARPAGG